MSQRPSRVSTAPDRPTAPPITPVARPLRSAYHFCAVLMTLGYKKAQPSPTSTEKLPKISQAASCGTRPESANPPASSRVPTTPAVRGPALSCSLPPRMQPMPKKAMVKAKIILPPLSEKP